MWNPSTLRSLPLCLPRCCHCGGPGESLVARFGVLCLIMVEASRGAVVPGCSPECMELGIGVWEGSSDRLQTADGVVDFTLDPSTI